MSTVPRIDVSDHTEPSQPLDSMHRTRAIAYCRVCNRQIAAETAAANAGNCHMHAPIDTRWRASDDWRP